MLNPCAAILTGRNVKWSLWCTGVFYWMRCFKTSVSVSTWSLRCISQFPRLSKVNASLQSIETVVPQHPLCCSFSLNNGDTVGSVLLFLWTCPHFLLHCHWTLATDDLVEGTPREKQFRSPLFQEDARLWREGGVRYEQVGVGWDGWLLLTEKKGYRPASEDNIVERSMCVFGAGVQSCTLLRLSLPEVPDCVGLQSLSEQ